MKGFGVVSKLLAYVCSVKWCKVWCNCEECKKLQCSGPSLTQVYLSKTNMPPYRDSWIYSALQFIYSMIKTGSFFLNKLLKTWAQKQIKHIDSVSLINEIKLNVCLWAFCFNILCTNKYHFLEMLWTSACWRLQTYIHWLTFGSTASLLDFFDWTAWHTLRHDWKRKRDQPGFLLFLLLRARSWPCMLTLIQAVVCHL